MNLEELLKEQEELLNQLRIVRAGEDINIFIDQYLETLKSHKTPVFHTKILNRIQSIGLSVIALNTPIPALKNSDSEEQSGDEERKDKEGGGEERKKDSKSSQGNKEITTQEGGGETPGRGGEKEMKSSPYFLQEKQNDIDTSNKARILIIAPRGFAKSTLCSVFLPLWLSIFGKKKDIFLVSATISLAKEHLRKIRNELENNEKIIEDFGELKSDKWTEDHLVLSNGTQIRAKGRGFQIRGFRPDAIICDDLEDEEVLYSKEQRDKLETWFFRTLLPALKPHQHLVYIGTKLHQFSLISKLEEKPEFDKQKYKAITEDKSIWEDLWPLETLKALRSELGIYAFEAEYQNNPLSLQEQPIKPHYLENVIMQGKKEVRCLAIDPAISEKESADFRSIVCMERTEFGFKEIFSEKGRWGLDEFVERIINQYEKLQPDRVLLEEIAFQKVLRQIILEKSRKKKLFIPISTAELGTGDNKRPRDKMSRLLSISHLFEQRLVEIVNPELKEELLAFPFGDYDDLVDACVYSLFWLMKWRNPAYLIKKQDRNLPVETKKSFYIEEVRPGVFITKTGEPKIRVNTNFINYDKS